MPDKTPDSSKPGTRYTLDEGAPGAFEGETVTRRKFMTGGAMAVGGVATAAFVLPALGFALGPQFEDGTPDRWQDMGPEGEFDADSYVPKVFNIDADAGEAGKSTVYIRRFNPGRDSERNADLPYVAITTRCAHLGCPVRYIQASARFVCPCHGGVYDFQGKVEGGPPVRPLDRLYTRVRSGRVQVGERFSLNSELRRFSVRDPSSHLDGLWQYLYPSRPST
ncbi:MAG: ubiquinol-cytochrome c reductase iron-sulfur subunit [Thermoleophilaceae bacterium]